ncbi:MAG: Calx-beta domain-containing protein, partial [Chloroflexota bacterium]
GGGSFDIFRYDWGDKEWTNVGPTVDTRLEQTFDTLWDEVDEKLYVVTHQYDKGPNATGPGSGAQLLRYSYDATDQSYTLDVGFPIDIALHQTESVTIAKDTTGQLWITFVSIADGSADYEVFVNRSTGDDLSWGTPFPIGTVDKEDVSAIVAFTDNVGPKVGIVWSELNTEFHFAYHADDNADDTAWVDEDEFGSFGLADDSVNVATFDGAVYAAVMTANPLDTDPGIAVLRRTAAGVWSLHPVSTIDDADARPIAVVDQGDPSTTGDEYLYVFMAGKNSGNVICYQRALIPTLTFPGGNCKDTADGGQVVFIADSAANFPDLADFNNVTSTKAVVSQDETGLLAAATSEEATTRYYGHNDIGDPPAVVNPRVPDFNATVPDTSPVQATFSRAMNSATITTASFIVEDADGPIAGTVGYDSGSRTATFTPDDGLIAGLDYTVKLTSVIEDTTGRELREGITSGTIREQWSFTVDGTAVQFNPASHTVSEDVGSVTMTAELTKASDTAVFVDYQTIAGTASEGNDYSATSGTLSFSPGETSKTFSVPILDDAVVEVTESLTVELLNEINASLGPQDTATIEILDDEGVAFSAVNYDVNELDGSVEVTVVLSGPSSNTVSVGYQSSDGTATAGEDYTSVNGTLVFPAGDTSETFNVPILDDGIIDDQETINLTLFNPINVTLGAISSATVTIGDDEGVVLSSPSYVVNETAGQAAIGIQLTGVAPDIVSVDYATSDGTATNGSDYTGKSGTVVFNAGETNKTVLVDIANDGLSEGTEKFNFTLSNAINVPLGVPSTAEVNIVDNETIQFNAASYSVNENAGSIDVLVELGGSPQLAVTIDYTTSDGTATNAADYTGQSGTLTFNPGETSKTITIPILDDLEVEPSETVNLTLSNPTNTQLGANATAVLTIIDNEDVTFSTANYSVNEQGGAATITAVLSGTPNSTVTVDYQTIDGSATAGNDYQATSGTLTFLAGETIKTFTVPVIDDSSIEPPETVTLRLVNPNNVTIGALSQATLTIVDNEDVHFSSASYTVSESESQVTVTVELSSVSPGGVSINYSTSDGNAQAGSDYTAVGGTLTFAPGEQFKTFTVPILNDDLSENNETFNVHLTGPVNVQLGSPDTAVVTITDNETIQFSSTTYGVAENGGFASITVQLAGPAQASVSVDYTSGDITASAGSDYSVASGTLNFNPGETSKTINVPIIDDNIVESGEQFALFLSNPVNTILGTNTTATVTINDNEYVTLSQASYDVDEFTGSATVTVELVGTADQTITVHYTTTDGTASAGSDYTSSTEVPVVFSPGETSKTFNIPILNDTVYEGAETVNIALTNPSNAMIGGQATALLTIQDDEAPVTVSFAAANVDIDEFAGAAALTVNLSGPAQATVTVDYATFDGTALVDNDYVATSGTLTFNPGETSKTINVNIIDDSEAENSETLNVSLTSPVNATVGTIGTQTVTIFDDENAPRVQFSAIEYVAGEGDGSITIEVTLSKIVLTSVNVNYQTTAGTATNGNDYLGTSGTLTFAPGETVKTFDISILEDALPEDDETVDLSLSNPVNAFLGAPDTALLTIADNESKIQFKSAAYDYAETDGSVIIEVAIVPPASSAVSIDVQMTADTATPGSDYLDASTTLNFVPGENDKKIFVQLVNDDIDEINETINLTLTNLVASSPVFIGLDQSVFTIIDNDDPPTLRVSNSVFTTDEEDKKLEIEVLLSTGSGQEVSVDYATSDVTATAGSDYMGDSGTLTFAPGEVSKTVELDIFEDEFDELNETFGFALANPVNATLTSPNSATVTIADDDATPSLTLEQGSYNVNENEGSIDIELQLSAPSGRDVTVDFATSDGTATAGLDYIGQSGTFTFAPGETVKTLTLLIQDDISDELAETLNIVLSNFDGAVLGAHASAVVTIQDDDSAPIVRFIRSTYNVNEGDGVVNTEVELTAPSSFEVTVNYLATNGTALTPSDYIVTPTAGQVTFAPGETLKTIPVDIVDDSVLEPLETMKLTLSNATNASLDGHNETVVEIVDNDSTPTALVEFSQIQYNVTEADGTILVEVRLSEAETQTVTVDYSVNPGTATTPADYLAQQTGTITFAPGEISKNISVTIVDDVWQEGDETLSITLSNPSGANIGSNNQTNMLIADNDVVLLFLPIIRK